MSLYCTGAPSLDLSAAAVIPERKLFWAAFGTKVCSFLFSDVEAAFHSGTFLSTTNRGGGLWLSPLGESEMEDIKSCLFPSSSSSPLTLFSFSTANTSSSPSFTLPFPFASTLLQISPNQLLALDKSTGKALIFPDSGQERPLTFSFNTSILDVYSDGKEEFWVLTQKQLLKVPSKCLLCARNLSCLLCKSNECREISDFVCKAEVEEHRIEHGSHLHLPCSSLPLDLSYELRVSRAFSRSQDADLSDATHLPPNTKVLEDHSLVISNATQNNNGVYFCILDDAEIRSRIVVTVLPPQPMVTLEDISSGIGEYCAEAESFRVEKADTSEQQNHFV